MNYKSLNQLYSEHEGKISDKWSLYLAEYDRIFTEYRNKPISMLEVGIQNGGSLEIWAKYFSHGEKFVGCDINSDCSLLQYNDPRIAVVIGDVNSDSVRDEILQHCQEYDIVIDDGSHISSDIIKTFAKYFPNIMDGGVFVAEDLHCSYWEGFEGGLFDPFSSITFFKLLADVINHEHWGVEKKRSDLLKGFCTKYEFELDEELLKQVHSISFINSMCVVRKSVVRNNFLGSRFIGGNIEEIVPGHTDIQGSSLELPSQDNNPWSISELSPYEELSVRKKELADRDEQIEELKLAVSDRNVQLLDIMSSKSWRATRPLREFRKFFINGSVKYSNSRKNITSGSPEKSNGNGKEEHIPESEYFNQSNLSKFDMIFRLFSVAYKRKGKFIRDGKRLLAILKSDGLTGVKQRIKYKIKNINQLDCQNYTEWISRYDTLTDETRKKMHAQVDSFTCMPLISVVMPTYNTNAEFLVEAIESVRNQIYLNWELCIADDASTDTRVDRMLKKYLKEDQRIKVVFREKNGHISAASNSALTLVSGEWVALLDHDDLLSEDALFWVAEKINQNPDVKLIYSDEDKIDKEGQRYDPYFKCDWNKDLFLSQNMYSHLGVFKADLVKKIEGFRVGFEGSQDYDLVLRSLEYVGGKQIGHIPRVLYHWRAIAGSTALDVNEKSYAKSAGERAINDYLRSNSIPAIAESVYAGYRVKYKIRKPYPLVSLIIPTRNMVNLLRQCIESIIEKSRYPNYEIIIIDNGSDDQDTLSYLRTIEENQRIKVIPCKRPFNYPVLNNMAVKCAAGEIVGLINNNIEVITPGWMLEMVSQVCRPGVGAVGALLLYPDRSIQHAGVIMGIGGIAANAHEHLPRGMPGFGGRAALLQSFTAVSGACLFVRKKLYEEVGGLNEIELGVVFSDIDFCLRLKEKGYRNIWTPYAKLYNHRLNSHCSEDVSTYNEQFNLDALYMKQRWSEFISYDPAYSPNLTLNQEDFSLAWPPRLCYLSSPALE